MWQLFADLNLSLLPLLDPPQERVFYWIFESFPKMNLTLASLLTAVLFATGALAEGEFLNTCDVKSVKVSGKTLTAKCKNILGQEKCNKLELNKCIKNLYGTLAVDPIGAG